MQIVNGYVCRDCTDVSLAKKGVDPAEKGKPPQASEAPALRREPEPDAAPRLASEGSVGTRLHVVG